MKTLGHLLFSLAIVMILSTAAWASGEEGEVLEEQAIEAPSEVDSNAKVQANRLDLSEGVAHTDDGCPQTVECPCANGI